MCLLNKLSALKNPIKTNSISRLVLERIKEALIKRELEPGDRLPSETELVASLGVGKSSVREAIKMLTAMGVVETRQGEGTFICQQPSADTINPLVFQLILKQGTTKDIIDLRAMFEPAYTLMAMHTATSEDIKAIESTIKRLEDNIKSGTQTAEDDLAFHYEILKSTHNHFVILIGETILQLFRTSIQKSMGSIPQIAVKDHNKVFEAFCEKNEKKLNKAILDSFEGWKMSLTD